MQFMFEGKKFSFSFRYAREEKTHIIKPKGDVVMNHDGSTLKARPEQKVTITVTRTKWEAACLLFKSTDGKWEEIMRHKAQISPLDQYSHRIGREVALGHFKHQNPYVFHDKGPDGKTWVQRRGDAVAGALFYQDMKECWDARFQTKKGKHA
jgi:hypothetical protein